MGKLFGTDGIRGTANETLTVHLAFKVGLAVADVMYENMGGTGHPAILIGMDTRISGTMFESAIAAGLCAGGAQVVLCGVAPTPAVAYLVKECVFDAGIMISASHNPSKDNGIKIFNKDGFKLSDELEEKIEYKIENVDEIKLKTGSDIGVVMRNTELIDKYIKHVANIIPGGEKSGLRVLIDCANGSASLTAAKIFTESYNLECDIINASPDGLNINKDCGSTHVEFLAEQVVSGKYDIGFAFDGDADRCFAVDETGKVIDGDMIMCALADDMKAAGTLKGDTVVVTKLSNLGLHKFCASRGYNIEQTDVGDRFILERMLQKEFNLGGEQSGHIISLDYASTGDGQITAALILNLLQKKKENASKVFGIMKKFPQVAVDVKIPPDKADRKQKILSDIDVINAESSVVSKLNGNGRIILRPSGTEPLIRIMIEGENQTEITQYAEEIKSVITRKL